MYWPRMPSRIIPACAGSTRTISAAPEGCRDHPRMRGEHPVSAVNRTFASGSSPHARGARRRAGRSFRRRRIIPACAGSTAWKLPPEARARDHPRMRGEHFAVLTLLLVVLGSSPHARGARRVQGNRQALHGIIPACAGSTVIYLQAYQMF